MDRQVDRKSLFRGALLGLTGCLAAWPLGEAVLSLATPAGAVAPAPRPGTAGEPVDPPPAPADPGPPAPPDVAGRLARAGARSGDVQVTLIWDDANDLDLHCVGPDGYDVYSATRDAPSPTGGRLDADANTACHRPGPEVPPVENIFWPPGAAPGGVYRVYVDGYERCPTGPAATRFRVSVLAAGRRQEFDGTVDFADRTGRQLVHQFELRPPAATPTASPAPPAPAETAPPPAPPGPPAYARGCWAALVAGGLVLAVVVGKDYGRGVRPLVSPAAGGLAAGGVVLGLAAGWLGEVLDSRLGGGPGVGFVLGWVLLGGLLAAVVSFRPPIVELKRATAVGLLGGVLGAAALFAGRGWGDGTGRLAAVAVFGSVVGAAGGLVRPRAARPATARPATPAVRPAAPPPTARPAVTAPKPVPAPPVPPPRAAPRPADACPGCGRKHPGAPGARHCVICDTTY